MRRRIQTALIISLAATLALAAASCGRSEVGVRTGQRVDCKYGHVISDTTRYLKVDASRARDYTVRRETTICALHLRALKLYGQAQKALSRKNKAAAKKLLAQVVAIDPHFEGAGDKYASLGGRVPAKGKVQTSSSSGGSGSSADNGSEGQPPSGTSTSGIFLSRIPESVSPYKPVSRNEDLLSGSRLFGAKRASWSARSLTISVRWIGKKMKFDDWYRKRLAARFSESRDRNVSVPRGTGRFGTDSGKLANLCWNRGGYVYQIEVEARSGNPGRLKGEAVRIAKLL